MTWPAISTLCELIRLDISAPCCCNSPLFAGPTETIEGICCPGGRGHILREIDKSLSRLQVDYVDIYLLHHPDPTTPIEETLDALNDLVQQGKDRYVGCCNFSAWQVCKALWASDRNRVVPFMCVQNHYNLLGRSLEEAMLPFWRSEGVGIMVYSPLSLGLLSGLYRLDTPPPAGTYWANRLDRYQKI